MVDKMFFSRRFQQHQYVNLVGDMRSIKRQMIVNGHVHENQEDCGNNRL